jgi:type IV pilus assembly protein PilQ
MKPIPDRVLNTAGLQLAAVLWLASAGAWAQVSSEFPRPAALSQAVGSYTGDKLSLNFQNIDVRSVLQVIADFTQLNIVTSDSVTGSVTLRLKDVPWDQALDIILQSRGLGMRRTGNVMLVAPREELAAKDQADLEVRRRISELEAMRTESFQLHYSRAEEVAKGLLGATIGSPAGAGSAEPAGGHARRWRRARFSRLAQALVVPGQRDCGGSHQSALRHRHSRPA